MAAIYKIPPPPNPTTDLWRRRGQDRCGAAGDAANDCQANGFLFTFSLSPGAKEEKRQNQEQQQKQQQLEHKEKTRF